MSEVLPGAADSLGDPAAPAFLTRNVDLGRAGLFARRTGTADRDPEHHVALVIGARTS